MILRVDGAINIQSLQLSYVLLLLTLTTLSLFEENNRSINTFLRGHRTSYRVGGNKHSNLAVSAFHVNYSIRRTKHFTNPNVPGGASSSDPWPLFMVSQKQKEKLAEGKERSLVYRLAEISKVQKDLENELQQILDEGKAAKQPVRRVNKLIKNVHHEGVLEDNDIGIKARLLALQIFYTANKPSEMVSPLLKSPKPNDKEEQETEKEEDDDDNNNMVLQENQLRFWAYSKLQDWNSALSYAERLFINNTNDDDGGSGRRDDKRGEEAGNDSSSIKSDDDDDGDSLFTNKDSESQLKHMAIQTFAATNRHLSKAQQLLWEECFLLDDESQLSRIPQSLNSLLESYITMDELVKAKTLYQNGLYLGRLFSDDDVDVDNDEGEIYSANVSTVLQESNEETDINDIVSKIAEDLWGDYDDGDDNNDEFDLSALLTMEELPQILTHLVEEGHTDIDDDDVFASTTDDNTTTPSMLTEMLLDIMSAEDDANGQPHQVVSFVDKESYRLALECASKLGDTQLMEDALGDKEMFRAALTEAANQRNILPIMKLLNGDINNDNVHNDKEQTGKSQKKQKSRSKATQTKAKATEVLELILRTMVTAKDKNEVDVFSFQGYQGVARDAIRVLLGENKIHPELLSKILEMPFHSINNRNETYVDMEYIIESCILHSPNNDLKTNKKSRATNSWHACLSVPAKVHMLPTLVFLERGNWTDMDNLQSSDSWNVLTSLVPIKKNGSISGKGLELLRSQNTFHNKEFVMAAWWVSEDADRKSMNEGTVLSEAILQECWKTLVLEYFTNGVEQHSWNSWIRRMMDMLPRIREETTRVDLFIRIVSTIRQEVMSISSSLSQAPKQQGRSIISESDDASRKKYDNDKHHSITNKTLSLIVSENLALIQSVSKQMALLSDSSDSISKSAQERLRYLAVDVSSGAMILIESMEYWSLWDRSDNCVKEASQGIMKELIKSNVLTDSLLVYTAWVYYHRLMNAATSSPVIDYKDLLFPYSTMNLEKSQDPYQDFRDCVMGTNGSMDVEERQDLIPLLKSIIEMMILYDSRTGAKYLDGFSRQYKDYFLVWRTDLFYDTELFSGLCETLKFAMLMNNSLIDDNTGVWFDAIWGSDLAQGMIERLGTCRDVERTARSRRDFTGVVNFSSEHLIALYSQVNSFTASSRLREDYIDACNKNCRYLVAYMVGDSGGKMAMLEFGNKGKAKRKSKHDPAFHFLTTTAWFIQNLGRFLAILDPTAFNTSDGTSSIPMMVEHVLDSFLESKPPSCSVERFQEALKSLGEKMEKSANAVDVRFDIRDDLKAWSKKNFGNAEKTS